MRIECLSLIIFFSITLISCASSRATKDVLKAAEYYSYGDCNNALKKVYSAERQVDFNSLNEHHIFAINHIKEKCALPKGNVSLGPNIEDKSDIKNHRDKQPVIKSSPSNEESLDYENNMKLSDAYVTKDRTLSFKRITQKDINNFKKNKSEFESKEAYEKTIESKLSNGYYLDKKIDDIYYDAEKQRFHLRMSTKNLSYYFDRGKLISAIDEHNSNSNNEIIVNFKYDGYSVKINTRNSYSFTTKYSTSFLLYERLKNRHYIGSNYFGVRQSVKEVTGRQIIIVPFSLSGLNDFKQVKGEYNFEYKYDHYSNFYLYILPNMAKSLKYNGITIRVYFSFDFDVFNIYMNKYFNEATLDVPIDSNIDQKIIGVRLQAISIYSTKGMKLLSKVIYN